MKVLYLVINVGLVMSVANPLFALDNEKPANHVQQVPITMTDDDIYLFNGLAAWSYSLKAVKLLAERDSLKGFRKSIEESQIDAQTKAALLAGIDKKLTVLERKLTDSKNSIVSFRKENRDNLLLACGLLAACGFMVTAGAAIATAILAASHR